MQIQNDGVMVLADYDVGIKSVQSLRHNQAKITLPKFSVTFSIDGKPVRLAVQKPDSVRQEEGRIEVAFSHRLEGLPDKRVQAVVTASVENPYGGLILQLEITNLTGQTLHLDHATVLDVRSEQAGDLTLGRSALEWSFFKQGFQSFSASGNLRMNERAWRPRFKFLRAMEENITNPNSRRAGDFLSEQVAQITNRTSGHVLMAGFIDGVRTFGDVHLRVHPKRGQFLGLTARNHFDQIPLGPNESIVTEPFLILFGSRSRNLLKTWADIVGDRMKARVSETVPTGWCSWYYYYTKVTEDEILSNINRLSELSERLPVHYIQVDDGYQAEIGDWLEVNRRFHSGMEDMATRILSTGFVPGIWTAPFYARPKSRIFREHPDWFLSDARGNPINGGWNPLWGGKVYALDPTHPDVQGHLHEVYTTLRAMGYRYFKCDFLYAATLPALRHDPRATRAQALRIGLTVIREAIGEESFLLGCGCPIQVAVGLVDGMRIGMDVTPFWNNRAMRVLLDDRNALCTHHSMVNTINRAFMHNRLFLNDPDCLLVRADRNRMTLEQVRALATVIALSGGMLVISDNMETIDEDRLQILETALRYRTRSMEVADHSGSFEPQVLVGRTDGSVLFGMLNFSGRAVSPIFDLKELMSMEELGSIREIRDVWNKKELKHQNGLLRIGRLAPHSARLIEVAITKKG